MPHVISRKGPGPFFLTLFALFALTRGAQADEPVVTVLADFEDDSVAASISAVKNVLSADCSAGIASIPARGQRSLAVEIGATTANASVACDLRFRVETRFDRAQRVASYFWLRQGEIEVAFRVRDARGRIFATRAQTVNARYRWTRVAAELNAVRLALAAGDAESADVADDRAGGARLAWPIEVLGYRVSTRRMGRQTVYIDDLEVEHRVAPRDVIRSEFRLDEPTKIYRPGSPVGAVVVLENRSRRRPVRVSVRLAWMRPDGTVLKTESEWANLPASGEDYRSYKAIDFSQRIDEPGLYRLVGRVHAAGWRTDNLFQTTIAVSPSNRNLPRGRSTFFGMYCNLSREPLADQLLEIDLAREIGVHLLAIDVPWRLIEPKTDRYDFERLDPLVDAISDRNMAAMLVITEPPDWLAGARGELAPRLERLLRACARHYGRKVAYYRPTLGVMGLASAGGQDPVLGKLQKQLSEVQPEARLLSAPFPAQGGTRAAALRLPPAAASGPHLAFQTEGGSAAALGGLRQFAQDQALTWQPWHWWLHKAETLVGDGSPVEAEAVLRHYVAAAAAGVKGLIWFDLRDDSAITSNVADLRGLARRDFSPKLPLLGYATAAGMLTGLRYAGPLHGTPAAFDSALFVGSDRQVAVLLPKPNRIRPAVIAPIRGVPGELKAYDFERRELKTLQRRTPLLVATDDRPFFVTLDLDSAQPEPQLALAQPWLSLPAPVFCGTDTTFVLEITAPFALAARSFAQLELAPEAPFDSTFSGRALHAEAGETLRYNIRLTPKPGRSFERATLKLRLSLEGRRLVLPLEVRPLVDVLSLAPGSSVTDARYRIADLATTAEPDGASAAATLYAGFQPRRLHLAVSIRDDRFITPGGPTPSPTRSGDRLLIGVGVENAERHAEVRVDVSPDSPRLRPAPGTGPEQLRGWRCNVSVDEGKSRRTYHLEIPARTLGVSRLGPHRRVLLAVRYTDDDGQAGPATSLRWGGGLDGSRSTSGFRWVRLAASPEK